MKKRVDWIRSNSLLIKVSAKYRYFKKYSGWCTFILLNSFLLYTHLTSEEYKQMFHDSHSQHFLRAQSWLSSSRLHNSYPTGKKCVWRAVNGNIGRWNDWEFSGPSQPECLFSRLPSWHQHCGAAPRTARRVCSRTPVRKGKRALLSTHVHVIAPKARF